MSRPIVFRRRAQADLACIEGDYTAIDEALGRKFLAALERALEHVVRLPSMHSVKHAILRRAPIRGFPYGLWYEVTPEALVVYRVLHLQRDPGMLPRDLA